MKKRSRTLLTLTTAALAAVAGAAMGQEPELTYSGSLQYASGDYTLSETTNSFLLFNGLSYRNGRWNLSATVPLINQDSPFVTYSGGAPVPSGVRQGVDQASSTGDTGTGSSNSSGSRGGGMTEVPDPDTLAFNKNGVGDPIFRADFAVTTRGFSGVGFGLYGAAKPPLANEDDGFGTGEWDYGAGITVSKNAGSTLLLADLGYWFLGDMPDLELQDSLAYSLGLGRSVASGRYLVLASVSGYTETLDGLGGPVQAAFTLSRVISSDRNFNVTLSVGLTQSAPDYVVSAGWRIGM